MSGRASVGRLMWRDYVDEDDHEAGRIVL